MNMNMRFCFRWMHGLTIPQTSERGAVMDCLPRGLGPMLFFALDLGRVSVESPLAAVREKLRESSV